MDTDNHFITGLSQSGLMSVDEVRSFQAKLPSDARPADSESLITQLIRHGKLTPYQAQMIHSGQIDGLVLGEYVVLDMIGTGGMGQVMKARHRTMGREVAVKILPPESVNSPEAIERFRQEIRAVSKLSHPNIVTAYDAGQCGRFHFLVMEYVAGRDLAAIVQQRGPLPVAEAIGYIVQAARGLLYAHEAGIVHRDIKPSNLLVNQEGVVRILDFGLARLNDVPSDPVTDETTGGPVTQEGQVLGTYDFMSPDQAAHTRSADLRSDVYSLGCTLFSILTGQRPYDGDGPLDKIVAHCMRPIPSVRDIRPEVPAALDEVVRKMMAKQPDQRYQSMAEVIEALQAVTADFSVGYSIAGSAVRCNLYAPTIATDAASTARSRPGAAAKTSSGLTRRFPRRAVLLSVIVLGLAALGTAGWRIWPRGGNQEPGQAASGGSDQGAGNETIVGNDSPPSVVEDESRPADSDDRWLDPPGRSTFGPFKDDAWDVRRWNIKILGNSPLGRVGEDEFDIHNLFGNKPSNGLFSLVTFPHSPPGTIHWVEWEVPQPITLRSFYLKAGHDARTYDRAFSRFTLFGTELATGQQINVFEIQAAVPYPTTPAPAYAVINNAVENDLMLRANVVPITACQFRAEFEQPGGVGPIAAGPRVMDLDGFETFCRNIPHPPETRESRVAGEDSSAVGP